MVSVETEGLAPELTCVKIQMVKGAFKSDAVGEFMLLADFHRQTGAKSTGFIGFNTKDAQDNMVKARQGFDLEKYKRFARILPPNP
jgi:hypothetical protein